MSPDMTGLLLRFCVCLAMVHWAHTPPWGAAIIFICLQINVGLTNLGNFLVTWTIMQAQQEDGRHLHAVPDEDPGA